MITGEQIKAARKSLNQSQAEFGDELGVSQSAIARWEDKGPPSRGPAAKAIERRLAEIRAAVAERA